MHYLAVFDDFEDGNFTENPSWKGTQNKFKVNSDKQLQLDDSMEAEAYLSTSNAISGDTEWRIWVKLGFSPSANNNARIYLVSNQENLSGTLNGYFLQLGESGSNDAIELFKQEGESESSVCSDSFSSRSFCRFACHRAEEVSWDLVSCSFSDSRSCTASDMEL